MNWWITLASEKFNRFIMSKIDDILSHYREGSHESLIPILQDVQEVEGYLSENAIVQIGGFLRMSTTKIYGLATFYDRFRFFPCGKVHLRICNGTTCFINGATSLIDAVREEPWALSPDRPHVTGRLRLTSSRLAWEDAMMSPVILHADRCSHPYTIRRISPQ
ncbi:MAG: NAD(P)H-dependent oxidoreductase subunit E [Bacteroidales bacterium]|nr:NAD(P)H-dependent oxidoreductase subunit E [Bacteroidales bacterium]